MDGTRFRRLCAGIERLSVTQVRQLQERLRGLDARIEVRARIDASREAVDGCLHCGATALQRWGATGTGMRRWRCRACRRTFCSTTGTALARLRRPEAFQQVLADMARAPRPALVPGTGPGARAEPDDGLALADAHPRGPERDRRDRLRGHRRGRREVLPRVAQGLAGMGESPTRPGALPQADRPRWRDYRRLGLLRPAGTSKYQIPVLTVVDRAAARRADVLPDRRAESLVALLEAHVGRDAVLCSDGDGAYDRFARARGMPHYRLHPKTGPKVIDTAFHIQTVNNLHSRFESFMKPFCGPATKHLPGYAAWFIARLIAGERTRIDTAWQQLLAA
jgi:ribosomal protein L37AE/L43A